MAAAFESIFNTNTEVDLGLSKLFKRKIDPLKEPIPDIEAEEEEPRPKKLKKLTKETEKRTIFVGNLNCDCKKEELVKIFKPYGKIETVRFRNIVPEDITKPKKYAYITKQQHPNKKSINGFVRFKEEESANNAAREVNGMEYKDRHLRVDVANKSKVHDNKRSVFLGALPFDVKDESVHSHFSKCGEIDNVRIIRDNKTGVGKGFGYVQFKTADSISLALKLDGTKLEQRSIRVSRAVKKQKENKKNDPNSKNDNGKAKNEINKKPNKFQNYSDKVGDQKLSKLGKVKHQKRHDALASQQPSKPTEKKPKKEKSSAKHKKEALKKKLKKKHVGTNNKNAIRFKI